MALDGEGKMDAEVSGKRLIAINGYSPELGQYRLSFPTAAVSKKYNYLVSHTPGLDQIKEVNLPKLTKFSKLFSSLILNHIESQFLKLFLYCCNIATVYMKHKKQ